MHTTHNYIWKDCHLWHHESRVWPLRHHLVKVPWLQPLRLREAMTCSSLRLWPQTTDNACQLYPTLGQSSIKVPRGECSLTVHTSLSLPTDHWRTVEWRSVQWTSKFSGNVDKIKFGTRFAHILTFWYPKKSLFCDLVPMVPWYQTQYQKSQFSTRISRFWYYGTSFGKPGEKSQAVVRLQSFHFRLT